MKTKMKNILLISATWILFPILTIKLAKHFVSYTESSVFTIIGIFLMLCSIYFFLKAYLLTYFVSESIPFIFNSPKRLVLEGPYLNSRHPLFYFCFLFTISISIIWPSPEIACFSASFFLLGILLTRIHEKFLLKQNLSEEYSKYEERVPFFFKFSSEAPKSPSLFRLLFQLILRVIIQPLFPLEKKGLENIPENGGVLFIASHQSYVDPFLLSGITFRNIRFLTTAELFKTKFNRLFFHLMGSIPIKRFTKDPAGIRRFFRLMHQGYALGYFPEGKRSWSGAPSKFPDGTLRLLKKVPVPIVPVTLSGFYELWPRWSTKMNRTKLGIQFHPPLDFDKNISDDELLSLISEKIFFQDNTFKTQIFSNKKINHKISTLFWRCPICTSFDSIVEKNDAEFECKSCHSTGQILKDFSIRIINNLSKKSETKAVHQWYKIIDKIPVLLDSNTVFSSQKSLLLKGNFPKLKRIDSGTFRLDCCKIIYVGRKKHIFNLDNIKQLYSENNKILHMVIDNFQVQIKLFYESPLKWERLYEEIKIKKERVIQVT